MSKYYSQIEDIDEFRDKCVGLIFEWMSLKKGVGGELFYIALNTDIPINTLYYYIGNSVRTVPTAYNLYLISRYLRDGVRKGEFEDIEWFKSELAKAIRAGMTEKNIDTAAELGREIGIDAITVRNYLKCKSRPSTFYIYLIDKYLDGAIQKHFEKLREK